MNPPKIYVPRSSAKLIAFERGGHIIKLGFHAESLKAFIEANKNEKGFINLDVSERREPSQHGDTHSVALDTWKPKQDGQRRESVPKPAATAQQADGGDDVPF